MLVQRDSDRLRLITCGGYDWVVIDGEAVILGVDGYSDFNALHAGRHNEEVQLCAFDVLAMDGDDLRDLPVCNVAGASAGRHLPERLRGGRDRA
jgi:hypothetical protein